MNVNRSFLLLVILTVSCSSNLSESNGVEDLNVQTIEVDLNNTEPLYMSDFFESLEYIQLQTPGDRPIGRIRKYLVRENFLAFYDQARRTVWLYNRDGEYLTEVRIPRGRGPGEIEMINDIFITEGGEVHALGNFKIVAYNVNNEFMHETAFDFYIYKFTYDPVEGIYIGYASNEPNHATLGTDRSTHNLLFFNREGRILHADIPIPPGREKIGYHIPEKFPYHRSETLFFPHLSDTVYTIRGRDVNPKYVLDYTDHSIPEEVFERRRNYSPVDYEWTEFVQNEIHDENYVSYLTYFNETDKKIVFYIHAGRGNPFTIVYDKERDEAIAGNGGFINDIDYGPVPIIFSHTNQELITTIDAVEFLSHLEDLYENEPEKYHHPKMDPLREMAESMEITDNPILMVAAFK
jgi:hypothetical protein